MWEMFEQFYNATKISLREAFDTNLYLIGYFLWTEKCKLNIGDPFTHFQIFSDNDKEFLFAPKKN